MLYISSNKEHENFVLLCAVIQINNYILILRSEISKYI